MYLAATILPLCTLVLAHVKRLMQAACDVPRSFNPVPLLAFPVSLESCYDHCYLNALLHGDMFFFSVIYSIYTWRGAPSHTYHP